MVGVVAGVGSVLILTRALGFSGFGVLAVALAYTAIVSALSDGGLQFRGPVALVHARDAPAQVLMDLLMARVLLALAGLVLGAGAAMVIYRGQGSVLPVVLVVLVSLLPGAVLNTWVALLQANLLLVRAAAAEAASRLCLLGAQGLLVALRAPLGDYALAAVGAVLLHSALLLIVAPGRVLGRAHPSPRRSWALLRSGLPLAMAGAVSTLYARVDLLLVAWLGGVAAAGVYAVAYRFLDILLVVPGLVGAAALPVLVARAGDRAGLASLLRALVQSLLTIMIPAAVVVTLLAPWLVRWAAGPTFLAAATPLRWLAVSSVVSSATIVLGLTLIAVGRYSVFLGVSVVGLAVNVGGNLVAIPRWGPAGAAGMTMLGETVALVVLLVLVRGLSGRIPWPQLPRPRVVREAFATIDLGTRT